MEYILSISFRTLSIGFCLYLFVNITELAQNSHLCGHPLLV